MSWFAIGALLAGVGVAVGAFGAHGLKAMVTPDMLTIWETGARYHMYAAVGLMLIGLAPVRVDLAGWLMLAGILLFSGSLYAMTLTGIKVLGAITPFGGLAMIAAWGLLALRTWQSSQ